MSRPHPLRRRAVRAAALALGAAAGAALALEAVRFAPPREPSVPIRYHRHA